MHRLLSPQQGPVAALLLLCLAILGGGATAFAPPLQQSARRTAASLDSVWTLSQTSSSEVSAADSSLFRSTEIAVNGAGVIPYPPSTMGRQQQQLSKFQAALVKAGMLSFIVGMCLTLPLTLFPQKLLRTFRVISRVRSERWALATGSFCARWLMRLIPFARIEIITAQEHPNPQPAVWVCNHQSMLDVFFLMAADLKMRGKNKRPLKIIYWEGLEENPVTKLLFQQCGFIPVAMAANKPGEANDYDKGSFKKLLKGCKQAFEEGFDVGILPEGQLNPQPENGLLPLFGGAFTLAKMARRPIHMMALHGTYNLWHPERGMDVRDRTVKVRNYHSDGERPPFENADEFTTTFEKVVGQFGTTGTDLPDKELEAWLSGAAWKQKKK